MSDQTNLPNSPDEARAEALAWLAGQFRWEALLADLHELAEKEAAPVVDLETKPEQAGSEDAEHAA
jgi:hypothetical protein